MPSSTVGQRRIDPPTWGTGGVPGVTIGHVCMSETRAAGSMERPNILAAELSRRHSG